MIDALYFCHIQKTAGTSVLALLDRYFAADEICPQQLWHELNAQPWQERRRYRLYAGHFGGGGVRALTGRDLPMMTFVREPAALARSTYLHLLREPQHRFVGAMKQTHSAAELINDPRMRGVFRNRQCASLSFDVERDPCAERVFFSAEALAQATAFQARSNPIVTEEERLKRAKQALDESAFVGIVERMEESMALFAHTFCLPHPGRIEPLRVAPAQKIDFGAFDAMVAKSNANDQALYAHAVALFEQRLESMQRALKANGRHPLKPWTWSRPNDLAGCLAAQFKAKSRAPATPCLEMGQALWGAGFHRREATADGRFFRWTGLTPTALWFRPARAVQALNLKVIDAASTHHLTALRANIEQRALAVSVEGNGPWTLTLTPSSTLRANRWYPLTLITPPPAPHRAHHSGSRDERHVGLAIESVHW